MPTFYQNQAAWREAIRTLFALEDAVNDLAAAFVASSDRYFADCLIELLYRWAAADALTRFHYTPTDRQAWFNIEDMLFAAGSAYSVVHDQIDGRETEKSEIDAWLAKAAWIHLSIDGEPSSCCNNHFYWRTLYASVIGTLSMDHELFRVGVSVLYSALHEMDARGELPREIERDNRAIHYQKYALLYLVPIAELIERQGYPAYSLSVDGRMLQCRGLDLGGPGEANDASRSGTSSTKSSLHRRQAIFCLDGNLSWPVPKSSDGALAGRTPAHLQSQRWRLRHALFQRA